MQQFRILQVPHDQTLHAADPHVRKPARHVRKQVDMVLQCSIQQRGCAIAMSYSLARMCYCNHILHLRFEETHKYFGKDMYALTAKRTKGLDEQLFRAAVYHDQISYLSAVVFKFIHLMVHCNDTFYFFAARPTTDARNPGAQARPPA